MALGHATIAVTLDLYSHVVPSLQREAAKEMRERLDPPTARRVVGDVVVIEEGVVALGVDAMAIVMARYLSHRAGLTWRETIFVFQGIPYSTVRHVAFLLGAMRKPRDATEYPRTEQVTKEPGLPISLALKQQRN